VKFLILLPNRCTFYNSNGQRLSIWNKGDSIVGTLSAISLAALRYGRHRSWKRTLIDI